jgi:hypothetical protein
MPRYLIHVRNHERSFDDEVGEAQTPEDAAAKATQIARELAADPGNYGDYNVVVTDEDGNEIADVLIAETV